MRRIVFLIIVLLVSFSFVGNAQEKSSDSYFQDVKNLKNSFYSYMHFRKNLDFDSIFNILCQETKNDISIEELKNMTLGATSSLIVYNLESLVYSLSESKLYVNEYYMSSGLPAPKLKTQLVQNWRKENGSWYLFLEKIDEKQVFMGCGRSTEESMKMQEKSMDKTDSPGCGR